MTEDIDPKNIQIDLSYLSDVAGGSGEFMIEMIDMFLVQTPDCFTEIDQSISANNWSKVGEVAHKIKPTFTFMGVNFVKEILAEIEVKAKKLELVEEIRPAFDKINSVIDTIYLKLEEEKIRLKDLD